MPKFVGSNARQGSQRIEDNAVGTPKGQHIRLTHAQQRLLPAECVSYSLDTTDRGGPRSYAKRWYRWFASREAINDCPRATRSMLDRARLLGPVAVH